MSTPMLGTGPMRGFGPMLGVGPMLGRSPLSGPVSQTPTFALDFARDQYSTLSPALTVSSPTGGVMVPDYLGNYHKTLANEIPIRGGRRLYNLLANTDTLATQGVTVEDADYWLSFKGTGSVAVTGVATDSLAGTGADDRVSKKVTMGSAGTATFTVTGSVTEAYLYKSRPGQTTADPEYVSRGELNRSMAVGDDEVTNGTFDTDLTGWSQPSGAHWTVSNGRAYHAAQSAYRGLEQDLTLAAGRPFLTMFDVEIAQGTLQVNTRATVGGAVVSTLNITESGTYGVIMTSAADVIAFGRGNSETSEFYIDNVTSKPFIGHGYGVDGLAWMRTDPSGLALADGLGPELVTNGDFSDGASGWAVNPGWEIVNGRAEHLPGGPAYLSRNGVFSVGKEYEITVDIGGENPKVELPSAFYDPPREFTGSGTKTVRTRAKTVTMYLYGSNERPGWIDNISVREVYPVPCTGIADWPQITNLQRYSNALASWVNRSNVTVTDNDQIILGRPFTRISPSATGSANRYAFDNIIPMTSGVAYTAQAKIISDGADYVQLTFADGTHGAGQYANFDLSTGALGDVVGGTATIRDIGSSVYLCTFSATATATAANGGIVVAQISSLAATRVAVSTLDTADDLLTADVHINSGAVALPFVPTAATAVTADAISSDVDLATAGVTEREMTVVMEYLAEFPAPSSVQRVFSLRTDADNRAAVFMSSTGGTPQLSVYVEDGNVVQWSQVVTADWEAGVLQRIAARFADNDGSIVENGAEVMSDASMTVPAATKLHLMGDPDAAGVVGSIAAVAIYEGA